MTPLPVLYFVLIFLIETRPSQGFFPKLCGLLAVPRYKFAGPRFFLGTAPSTVPAKGEALAFFRPLLSLLRADHPFFPFFAIKGPRAFSACPLQLGLSRTRGA